MNLHEYQVKGLFKQFAIPVNIGQIATTAEEAVKIAEDIRGSITLKAQVLAGERARAGGIQFADDPQAVFERASAMLNTSLRGLPVHKLLIEPVVKIDQELYLGITYDRSVGQMVLMASTEGGSRVEKLHRSNSKLLIKEYIDPIVGLHNYQIINIASNIELPRRHWHQFSEIAHALYRCSIKNDALIAEINPLAITEDAQLIAIDGKLSIDDNALYRHPLLCEMRDTNDELEAVTIARESGISYVKLGGQIGCVVNGAGLAMTIMDLTQLYGGEDGFGPANFLDIGGGARADKVFTALKLILSDTDAKSILVSIFGGITRCDEVAMGIIEAYLTAPRRIPAVIRLQGTEEASGQELIARTDIPEIVSATTLTEAVTMAIDAARDAH